jgi:hypothetical protein
VSREEYEDTLGSWGAACAGGVGSILEAVPGEFPVVFGESGAREPRDGLRIHSGPKWRDEAVVILLVCRMIVAQYASSPKLSGHGMAVLMYKPTSCVIVKCYGGEYER